MLLLLSFLPWWQQLLAEGSGTPGWVAKSSAAAATRPEGNCKPRLQLRRGACAHLSV